MPTLVKIGNVKGPRGDSYRNARIDGDNLVFDRVTVNPAGEVTAPVTVGHVRGPIGPQGLPGTNAVPSDTAVAGYISTTGDSETKRALAASFVRHGEAPVLRPLTGMSPNNEIGATRKPTPVLDVVGAMSENIVKDGDTYWLLYSQQVGSLVELRLASGLAPEGPWTPGAQPLFTLGSQAWEGTGSSTNGGSILKHEGVFYLFYSVDTNGTGEVPTIGVATATTVTGPYTKYAGNPLLPLGAAGTWDSLRVQEPHVMVAPDGTWVMAYMAEDSAQAQGTTEKVGIATAPDPFGPWTKAAGNPVIGFGQAGTFDVGGAADPSLFFENGYYWCLYSGLSAGGFRPWQLGLAYATSPTGPWTRHQSNPILRSGPSGSFDFSSVWRGALFREGDTIYLPYGGIPGNGAGADAKGGAAKLVLHDPLALTAQVTAKVNLDTNPSREVDLTGVAQIAGTGGTSALSHLTTGGKRGAGFARQTWSVAPTAAGNGTYDVVPDVLPGKRYSAGVWVRSSVATRMYCRVVFTTSTGASIATDSIFPGVSKQVPANVWTRLTIHDILAPPTTAKANLQAWTAAGTGYVHWAAGDTLDTDAFMFNEGPVVWDDFDGSDPAAGDVWYGWAGVAHASKSFRRSRPAAPSVLPGTIGFDPYLGRPVWSNGTAWVDATGAVVA